ncbi:MAG: putative Methylated-DNA--protein-cysteine methyltransferase, constitutive [Streblomastix strix]|uniref:Methylated-DNA--protein-cysteine methyltransferase n=1 Tax=Streblomastix strix TaxID=222440 RepID=A0A5J4UUG6_9EUKA|nr:MAG: putative Methylated-DNA--protein-cysteine methyltransferase, constitutive [Streblomastix strix]
MDHRCVDNSGIIESNTPLFDRLRVWLADYFAGKKPTDSIPIKPSGTEFQNEVWDQLQQIKYGETKTYGEIAKNIAKKRGIDRMSAQAVGQASNRNPIALLIPCHRMVGADGIGGYGHGNSGIESKRTLLKLEGHSNL